MPTPAHGVFAQVQRVESRVLLNGTQFGDTHKWPSFSLPAACKLYWNASPGRFWVTFRSKGANLGSQGPEPDLFTSKCKKCFFRKWKQSESGKNMFPRLGARTNVFFLGFGGGTTACFLGFGPGQKCFFAAPTSLEAQVGATH